MHFSSSNSSLNTDTDAYIWSSKQMQKQIVALFAPLKPSVYSSYPPYSFVMCRHSTGRIFSHSRKIESLYDCKIYV